MKKFMLAVVVGLCMVIALVLSVSATSTKKVVKKEVVVQYNGKDTGIKNAFIQSNRTFVPLRSIANALKYQVKWTPTDKTIDIWNDTFSAQFRLGRAFVYMYGEDSVEMDVVPMIVNNTTYIPLRYAVVCLGKFVEVYDDGGAMIINITDRTPTQDLEKQGGVRR